MTGFESQTSVVGSKCSTNIAMHISLKNYDNLKNTIGGTIGLLHSPLKRPIFAPFPNLIKFQNQIESLSLSLSAQSASFEGIIDCCNQKFIERKAEIGTQTSQISLDNKGSFGLLKRRRFWVPPLLNGFVCILSCCPGFESQAHHLLLNRL